jgi:Icc-related predicted phosphoesterase
MKVIAISDLHGELPYMEDIHGDVLCICGDTFPLKIQWNAYKCKKWLREKFIPWTNNIGIKFVLLVAGNHDFLFEKELRNQIDEIFKGTKIKYLENEHFIIDDIVFYGTPYCRLFGSWAFTRDDERLQLIFENIPNNVDVLLTHDSPYGVSDICYQDIYWNTGEHLGNKPLREAVLRTNPKFLLHGHLHSSNHDVELLGETKVYNVSLLDENYKNAYKPLILDL